MRDIQENTLHVFCKTNRLMKKQTKPTKGSPQRSKMKHEKQDNCHTPEETKEAGQQVATLYAPWSPERKMMKRLLDPYPLPKLISSL